jgi:hypothetical protein
LNISAYVFGFTISGLFVGGCTFVFVAIVLYSRDDEIGKAGDGANEVGDSARSRYLPVQTGDDDSFDSDKDNEHDVDNGGMVEIAMTEVDSRGSFRD